MTPALEFAHSANPNKVVIPSAAKGLPAVDHEQELALLDLAAVDELAGTEEALHPGAQVDLVDGGGPADELELRREGLQDRGLDQYGGRRRALLASAPVPGNAPSTPATSMAAAVKRHSLIVLAPRVMPCKHCLNSTKQARYFRLEAVA